MLFDRMRTDHLAARRTKDEVRTNLLATLIGDAVTEAKKVPIGKRGSADPTDDEVIAAVKRFLKNAEQTRANLANSDRPDDVAQNAAEIEILRGYLPKQMTEEEIAAEARSYLASHPGAAMGQVMGFLKENFAGRYDGRTASTVVKSLTT